MGIYKRMCQHIYRTHKKLVTVVAFGQGRRLRERGDRKEKIKPSYAVGRR